MYASNFIIGLIAVLSAGALAVPITMTPALKVRSDAPPIGIVEGYALDSCTGQAVNAKKTSDSHDTDNCITFNTTADNIGITYDRFHSMRAYSDAHCKDQLGLVSRPGPNYSERQCVNQQTAFGRNIASVKFFPKDDGTEAAFQPRNERWNEDGLCDIHGYPATCPNPTPTEAPVGPNKPGVP